MKMNEKIKFLILGAFLSLGIFVLMSFQNENVDSEIGRYQISTSVDSGYSAWILDTKTGAVVRIYTNESIKTEQKNGVFLKGKVQNALNGN